MFTRLVDQIVSRLVVSKWVKKGFFWHTEKPWSHIVALFWVFQNSVRNGQWVSDHGPIEPIFCHYGGFTPTFLCFPPLGSTILEPYLKNNLVECHLHTSRTMITFLLTLSTVKIIGCFVFYRGLYHMAIIVIMWLTLVRVRPNKKKVTYLIDSMSDTPENF